MNKDDEQCLTLGREVVRLIHELRKVAKDEAGYVRRGFTFPGGEVFMLLANDRHVADLMDRAANQEYNVETVKPPSQMD